MPLSTNSHDADDFTDQLFTRIAQGPAESGPTSGNGRTEHGIEQVSGKI